MKRYERRNKKAQRVAIPMRLCVVCCIGISVVAKYILLPPHPYNQMDRQECDRGNKGLY